MIGGDVSSFIDHSTYEEVAVLYKGKKYFFRGLLLDRSTGLLNFEVELWCDEYTETVYCATARSEKECMEKFLNDPIIDGKRFWEIEKEMEWVEW